MKHLQNLMFYVKDRDRIGLPLGFLDTVTEDEFLNELDAALLREERRQEMMKTGKSLIST